MAPGGLEHEIWPFDRFRQETQNQKEFKRKVNMIKRPKWRETGRVGLTNFSSTLPDLTVHPLPFMSKTTEWFCE
jgi:hypothetical protein